MNNHRRYSVLGYHLTVLGSFKIWFNSLYEANSLCFLRQWRNSNTKREIVQKVIQYWPTAWTGEKEICTLSLCMGSRWLAGGAWKTLQHRRLSEQLCVQPGNTKTVADDLTQCCRAEVSLCIMITCSGPAPLLWKTSTYTILTSDKHLNASYRKRTVGFVLHHLQ